MGYIFVKASLFNSLNSVDSGIENLKCSHFFPSVLTMLY